MIIIIFSQWPDHQGRDGDTSLPLPALLKTRWQISVFIGSDNGAGVGGDRSIMVWMVMVTWLPDADHHNFNHSPYHDHNNSQ